MWNPFARRKGAGADLPAAHETAAPTDAPGWLGGDAAAAPAQANPLNPPVPTSSDPAPGPPAPAAGPAATTPTQPSPPSGPSHGGERASTRSRIAEVELIGHTAVATITSTELSQEQGARELAELLEELVGTGALNFVLDMDAVQFMDSACLGCLVEALNQLSARGGRIALANSNHSVHYIFRLTRLDRVFSICTDVMSALQSVEGTNIRLR